MARKRKNALREDLAIKKAQRKRAMIICVVGVTIALCVVIARQILAASGTIPYGTQFADTLVYLLTLAVCFFIAPQFMGFLRLGREIKELETKIAHC